MHVVSHNMYIVCNTYIDRFLPTASSTTHHDEFVGTANSYLPLGKVGAAELRRYHLI